MRLNFKKSQNFFQKKINSWECPDLDAKNQPTEIWVKSFPLDLELLFVTLMNEIKPVVTEKHHVDNRDESFL